MNNAIHLDIAIFPMLLIFLIKTLQISMVVVTNLL